MSSAGLAVQECLNPKSHVKVYVIDPKKFQQGEKPRVTAVNRFDLIPGPTRKRILPTPAKENRKEQEEDEGLVSLILSKKSRTRAGRLTRPRVTLTGSPAPLTGTNPNTIPSPKVRKREPPEYFRCQTCHKFYLGNAKLKTHLKKFPTHEASPDFQKTVGSPSLKRRVIHTSVAVQSEPLISSVLLDTPTDSVVARTAEEEQTRLPLPAFPGSISAERIFNPLNGDLSDSNSMPMGITPTTTTRPFHQEHSEELHHGPSVTSESLPFWNAFSTFSSARDESSSDGGPESVGPLVRKDESGEQSTTLENNSGTVWDLVERKLVQNGINQILLELSDVAEKLGKIARDKIIPIREDEEERLPSSTPIVRVENPFMSHLLDLPFGNYIFREEGWIRRAPLPPPSTDLSLTAGEVDIDKFLACNMEMDLSLPHLTSLDIAAVCNN